MRTWADRLRHSCVLYSGSIPVVGWGRREDVLAYLVKPSSMESHAESLIADLLNGITGVVELPSSYTNPEERRHHSPPRVGLRVGDVDVAIELHDLATRSSNCIMAFRVPLRHIGSTPRNIGSKQNGEKGEPLHDT